MFAAAASVATLTTLGNMPHALAASTRDASASATPLTTLPVRQVRTDLLDIGYHEADPPKAAPSFFSTAFRTTFTATWTSRPCSQRRAFA